MKTNLIPPTTKAIKPLISRDDYMQRGLLLLIVAFLSFAVILPLYSLLSKSVEDEAGTFVGLQNFIRFFNEPGLAIAAINSIYISVIVTVITVVLAFGYAYAINRSNLPAKGLFQKISMTPLLAPSLLPAIALIYLFGEQGVAKWVLFGHSVYGPIGIVIGEVLFAFPHAVLILSIALASSDQRLHEAAVVLRASPARAFYTVTLPECKFGLVSASMAVFTLTFTDFGVPSVIGGSYPVLATEIYKQVIGRFDFQMGAVVGIFLLGPAVLAFIVDRIVARKQKSVSSSSAVPLVIKPKPLRDSIFTGYALFIAFCMIGMISMAALGSVVKFWPYNMSLTLEYYNFSKVDSTGWDVYTNSLILSFSTASIGCVLIFFGAYLIERMRGYTGVRGFAQLLCTLPLAVPGMVLGISYIFFFNNPANPFSFIYGTMIILVLCTLTHFYTVPHLTAITALKKLDSEFESVSASMKVPFYNTLRRIVLPICLPAILDIWGYLFVNAMTTVSAVVFIYSADVKLASITVLNWNNAGKLSNAAALSMVIFLTSVVILALQAFLTRGILSRTQVWRKRD